MFIAKAKVCPTAVLSALSGIPQEPPPMESDVRFYRRHYAGGVDITDIASLDEYERMMFSPGARYHLVADQLARTAPKNGHLVEIGCGGAAALMILRQRHNFSRVTGIDVATSSAGHHMGGIELLASNLNDEWPFPNGDVDYLIAMMVIEHLFDPFHAFREIKRVLSKTGEAYVNLPLVTSWRNRARLFFGNLPVTSSPYPSWFDTKEWDGNHLHYFSLRSIHDLARSCGLRVSDIRGVGKLANWKTRWPSLLASEVTFQLRHER